MASKSDRERYIAENSEYSFDEDLFAFNMLNEETIEALKRGDISFPYEEMKRKIVNIPKDERWNMKQMTSKLMQGILNGDSIPKISESLLDVIHNNTVSATRAARTLVTQAENMGRLDSYKDLDEQGVVQEKVWIATPDSRTRASHLDVDGETVGINDTFSNGLEYPADPSGDPAEVYNCRCSMRTEIVGFRRADGSISRVDYERDDTMHYGQILEEKNIRNARKIEQIKEKAESAKLKAEKPQKEVLHGDKDAHDRIEAFAQRLNVAHNEVKDLEKPLTDDEIIQKLAGGDMTKGSCSSLAYAYCANKVGLDVIDFRGGDSTSVLSRNINIPYAYKAANAEIKEYMVKREAKDVAKIIGGIDANRQYVLRTGRHAAVIRKNDDGALQYLELQSSYSNGWKKMEGNSFTVEDTLKQRFACRKTVDRDKWSGTVYEKSCLLIPVDSVQPTEEYRNLLGYINTDVGKQKKGASGFEK